MRWAVLSIGMLALFHAVPVRGAENPRLITVEGNAEVRVVPDEVVVTLGIETFDRRLAPARAENDRRVRRLLRAADSLGVQEEGVRTEFINIEPRFTLGDMRRLEGYTARKTIVITLKDLDRFEPLLTAALSGGTNYLHGVEFRTTELRRHRDRARELALQAAREKAEAMAKVLDQSIGEPYSITEESSRWWSTYSSWWGDRWGRGAMQNVVQAQPSEYSPEGPAPPGQIAVSAAVHVSFELTD